jgi:protocatechuate 3,4-dioxygenase beta subunit
MQRKGKRVTKRWVPTPAIGDETGLSEARAARRRLLAASLAGLALAGVPPGARAQARTPTPRQTAGPFYPRDFPPDGDNDLVAVRGQAGLAQGEILLLAGTVVDTAGRPVAGARVEIWQCNALGRYHHPGDRSSAPIDPAFQGWGEFVTGADGAYRFRTIKPVPYPGRTPHIHFRVTGRGFADLVTQLYVEGEPGNARDGLYNALEPSERAAVTVRLERAPDGKALATRFEIVVRS